MTGPRVVVVDTNVVVAGLLTADATSPTAVVLDGMVEARFDFLLSEELLAEYRRVLLRPVIRERHGLDERQVDELLAAIVQNGIVREPDNSASTAPDRDDQHLWDLAASDARTWVVTGDRLLLGSSLEGFVVVSARELVAALGSDPHTAIP